MSKPIIETHYPNTQWQLEALLYAAKRKAICITDEVMDKIQVAYELAHSSAQEQEPEKTITSKKMALTKKKVEIAVIVMDSDIHTEYEAVAEKFPDSEIRVNPNDLTVFRVNFTVD